MNIWGRESVWFSRPPIQAVSCSFFTVKQNPKAGYYKWHIPEISQSQGPRHHNVLHSMRSHTEHNLKAFEQVLFVFWRKSGRFSFFKERNTATEIGHGAALKGSTEGNQSWSYRERCRASGLGSARLPAAHTLTRLPPRCRRNYQSPLRPREVSRGVWSCLCWHPSTAAALQRNSSMKPKDGCSLSMAEREIWPLLCTDAKRPCL